MEENYDKILKELSALAKRLNLSIIVGNKPSSKTKQYLIRFTMKRRWGGVKKYAYACTLDTMASEVANIEAIGGKIIGIDD